MHGEATSIEIVLQGLHGNGVVLLWLMVYGSGTIGRLESRSATGWAGRRVEWSVGDSRIVWMGTLAKGRALFIFDFGLHVGLVSHEALTRHGKVG